MYKTTINNYENKVFQPVAPTKNVNLFNEKHRKCLQINAASLC
jgi:hypothetical protein